MTYDPFDPFEEQPMYMDSHVRALPKDWPTLIALGVKLGALSVHESEEGEPVVSATTPGCWDFIGVLHKPTGETITTDEGDVPEMAPVADEKGTPYWHANLRTTVHLGAVARELAQTDPDIAAAMQSLDRFFLLDDAGNPRAPKQPARGYA